MKYYGFFLFNRSYIGTWIQAKYQNCHLSCLDMIAYKRLKNVITHKKSAVDVAPKSGYLTMLIQTQNDHDSINKICENFTQLNDKYIFNKKHIFDNKAS